jgi:hypothetical protein
MFDHVIPVKIAEVLHLDNYVLDLLFIVQKLCGILRFLLKNDTQKP